MQVLIDTQKETLKRRISLLPEEQKDLILGQLLTPVTGYRDWGGPYAIDNGAVAGGGFNPEKFRRLLGRQQSNGRIEGCLFVTCPDVLGSGIRTLELFKRRRLWMSDVWPVALVAQDGIENLEIPWDEIAALFVGGMDPWKDSKSALDVVKTAKILGKTVHVGRVNTISRFRRFEEAGADTCDGSGIAMYDHMLKSLIARNKNRKDPELPFQLAEGDR